MLTVSVERVKSIKLRVFKKHSSEDTKQLLKRLIMTRSTFALDSREK